MQDRPVLHAEAMLVGVIGIVDLPHGNHAVEIPLPIDKPRIGRDCGPRSPLPEQHGNEAAQRQSRTRATPRLDGRPVFGTARNKTAVGQGIGGQHADVPFQERLEQVRGGQAHGHAAQRPAGREHQVELRQMPRGGPQPHEFAVADHADEEHRAEVQDQFVGEGQRHAFVLKRSPIQSSILSPPITATIPSTVRKAHNGRTYHRE